MFLLKWSRFANLLIVIALFWAVAGAVGLALTPLPGLIGVSEAADPTNPCNPCNPCAAQAANPCNPCAAQAVKAANPCNPCAAQAANPCNPCAAQAANPCNPCAAQAANPCNPCAAKAANPCNPCAAKNTSVVNLVQGSGAKIGWGQNFKTWESVTGYVKSNSHGNRIVVTYITPASAARIYRNNARLVREHRTQGYEPFPAGATIVQESWVRNSAGGPGDPGPLFLMQKREPGYDGSGNDWRYGFTRTDMSLLGEGHSGTLGFCKECHTRAKDRDFVFATAR